MENKLQNLLDRKPFVLLDGAMGTMLQKRGLNAGERPELFVLHHPEIVTEVHREYLQSGSNILYTCTFGANRKKLAGTGVTPTEVIRAAVSAAKNAAADFAENTPLIALDIGPIGELMRPAGSMKMEEAYDIFREMVTEGEKAGADLVVLETMSDLGEVRAAVLAVKENTSLPVMVTMTFEKSGRTFTGCLPEAMAHTLSGMGVDAIGINCSLGPADIYPFAARIAACTDLPLVVKANAGLPDANNVYEIGPEEFARQMKPYADLGIRITGGCCGTTPAYIAALREALRSTVPAQRNPAVPAFCTAAAVLSPDGLLTAGECLNPTNRPDLQQALLDNDLDTIVDIAADQADAGVDLLDVNVGCPGVDEPALMAAVVEELQGMFRLPLLIDSDNPAVVEAGLRAFHGVSALNSVNGTEKSLSEMLPLAAKYGAFVIGLAMDEEGLPETAEKRLAIAEKILARAASLGIPKERVLIDCVTVPLCVQPEQCAETLRAVRLVKEKLGVSTVLGISNISHGLPDREALNRSFLKLAMENGLSMAILNPNQQSVLDAAQSSAAGEPDAEAVKILSRWCDLSE